jgi:predicted protein tyrosine phosphatase
MLSLNTPKPERIMIIIAGRSKARKLSYKHPHAKIISMTDTASKPAHFHTTSGNVLMLRFDDEEDPAVWGAPTAEHVSSILSFARRFGPGDTVVVHCEAGICRSSAVALGVYALHYGLTGIDEAFDSYRGRILPNSLLAMLLDEALGLNGEFIAVCERICKEWDTVKCGY